MMGLIVNCEDISRFIHGCDISSLKGKDFEGHVGVMMMYSYLSKPNFDIDKFSREFRFEIDTCLKVYDRFEKNGMYRKYNWPWKSRFSLLSILKHKSKTCVLDWCHISAMASGYVGV